MAVVTGIACCDGHGGRDGEHTSNTPSSTSVLAESSSTPISSPSDPRRRCRVWGRCTSALIRHPKEGVEGSADGGAEGSGAEGSADDGAEGSGAEGSADGGGAEGSGADGSADGGGAEGNAEGSDAEGSGAEDNAEGSDAGDSAEGCGAVGGAEEGMPPLDTATVQSTKRHCGPYCHAAQMSTL